MDVHPAPSRMYGNWTESVSAEARRVLRSGGRLVVAAQGSALLCNTWQVLEQAPRPPEPRQGELELDVRLPVTVTADDARALAQSYGAGADVPTHRFPFGTSFSW